MSNPKTYKENVKSHQTVMGDFFSRSGQSKTSVNSKGQKTKSPEKVKKEEKKALASQGKGAEKKKVQTGKVKTQEVTEKTGKEVGKKEDRSKAVEKKADKSKTFEKKAEKSITVVNREEKGVQRTSIKRKITGAGMFSFSWTRGAQRDTEEYRNGYPNKKDNLGLDDNYKFYTNQISSQPDGNFIDKIHVDWWGDYKLLEVHHGYIQWLFPIRESGLNWHAQELQLHEIKKIQKNKKAMKRLLTSYKMMLDFYGMELENEDDGTIKRADNWRERFRHLNKSYHNYLRITRILKCLGEFGYEHLKKNFVKFVLYEGLVKGTLSNVIDSCVKYWIGVLKEDEEREEMFDYYEELAFDENMSSKRMNRSPSPPSGYWSSLQTDSKSGKNVISKPDGSTQDEPTKKTDEKDEDDKKEKLNDEFSDDDNSTLYYAMSLIDDSDEREKNGNTGKLKDKHRKEHEISDSDEEIENSQTESQEMKYWNNESKSASMVEIEGGSESYNSIENADVQEEVENKIDESEKGKLLSNAKESLLNDKVEIGSEDQGAMKKDCVEKIGVDGSNDKESLVNDKVETSSEDQEAMKTFCVEKVEVDDSNNKESLVNDKVETGSEDQEGRKMDCVEKVEVDATNDKESIVNDKVETVKEAQEGRKSEDVEKEVEVYGNKELSQKNVSKDIKSAMRSSKKDEMEEKVTDDDLEKMDTSDNYEPEPIKDRSLDITTKTEDEITQTIHEADGNQDKEEITETH